MKTGDRIAARRSSLDLTQDQLADKTGLKRTSIQAYEANRNAIPSETLALIADALKVSTDYLLGRVTHPYDTYKSNSNLTSEEEKNLAAFLTESEMMLRENAGVDEEVLNNVLRYMKFTFLEKLNEKNKK